jgi:cytochrome b561
VTVRTSQAWLRWFNSTFRVALFAEDHWVANFDSEVPVLTRREHGANPWQPTNLIHDIRFAIYERSTHASGHPPGGDLVYRKSRIVNLRAWEAHSCHADHLWHVNRLELPAVNWSDWHAMGNRVAFLVCLDTAMLLLVCVLEPIKLTGLEWHQYLGFALCPLVLLHVVMQWQWFVTQFQGMGRRGGYRVRLSALLNLILFVLMAAVLFSGVFASRQSTVLIGESAGRVRLWHDVHGWLNLVLVVFVGLHLALNWDWILAALRRKRPRRPGCDTVITGCGGPTLVKYPGRGSVVLLIALLAAGTTYFAIKLTLPQEERVDLQNQRVITASADPSQKKQLAPAPRPADVLDGLFSFAVTVSIALLVATIGRKVFHLRL